MDLFQGSFWRTSKQSFNKTRLRRHIRVLAQSVVAECKIQLTKLYRYLNEGTVIYELGYLKGLSDDLPY